MVDIFRRDLKEAYELDYYILHMVFGFGIL